MGRLLVATTLAVSLLPGSAPLANSQAETTSTVTVRGRPLKLRLFGTRGNTPIVVTSGDGGWIHLAPHVADVLAGHGYFVVGVDAKEYLSSFTTRQSTLTQADVPGDYLAFVDAAASGAKVAPILAGVSEGAGLSVLAATGTAVKDRVRGVIGIGLPEKNELGWRWRDSIIYLTHGVPDEPVFNTSAVIDRVSPVPVAAIHSTRDEFVPLQTAESLLARAKEPKRLWTIAAADHRFSDNLKEFDARLLEAIAWVGSRAAGGTGR